MLPQTYLSLVAIAVLFFAPGTPAADPLGEEFGQIRYVCPPCYHVENILTTEEYVHNGQCHVCGMNLIENSRLLPPEALALNPGSGNYLLQGRPTGSDKTIRVFYHKPEGFHVDSPILLVIPGAGRNAWSYRDNWISTSERYGVLILSPEFAERHYDFAAYHLGGVVTNFDYRNAQVSERPNRYRLKDEDILFDVVDEPERWTFKDLDRIFNSAVAATGSQRTRYDIFGHSAGGQMLHRLAIFLPNSNADRIIAANSGSYTLPVHDVGLPFGLKDTPITEDDLTRSFAANLVLLIGEEDNEQEMRGTMLHTPLVDQQGLGRLSRGQYFYRVSRERARELSVPFNWQLEIVEGVGHDNRAMGKAAALILYEPTENR